MKPKTLTAFIAFVFTLFTTCVFAQGKGYTISGNIKGLHDGIKFFLVQDNGSEADTIDRTESKDGKFTFKGSLVEEGRLVFVKMDTSIVKIVSNKIDKSSNRRQSWVRLFLDNSDAVIQLKGDLIDWPEIKIEGSKLTEEYNHYLNISIPLIKELAEEINGKIQDAQNAKDNDKIAELRKTYSERYIENLERISSDSYVVPLILYKNKSLILEVKEAAYDKLSHRQKNSYYGLKVKQAIAGEKASKNIAFGKVIPDFQVKTPEGKLESVRNVVKKSKYTLIDFWASWCTPCRMDIPNLKMVYNAFHSKGFNILSVSTDSSLASWHKALKEENTPWVNGIQEEKPSKDIFGLIAIPGYILLNERAEIVQMDLNSEFFSRSVGTINGSPAFLKDSTKKGLRGNNLYEVIEGLMGKPEVK